MKYPRIYHIPGSPGTTSDDRILTRDQWSVLANTTVVATEKMDGENTTMTREGIHARSEDSLDHPSRHYVKALWGAVRHTIPIGWRLVGENLFARHSIAYDDLTDWFQVFAVFDAAGNLLSYDNVEEFANQRGLQTVPLLGEFQSGKEAVEALKDFDTIKQEGFVLRSHFVILPRWHEVQVAKWVRAKHVTTGHHWMYQEIVPNGRINTLDSGQS
jgi:hypothetical protein